MDHDTEDARRWLHLELAGVDDIEYDPTMLDPENDPVGARRSANERAALDGDIAAMYRLALAADERLELIAAEEWWSRAARRHDVGALFNLGVYAFNVQDFEAAGRWWGEAAMRGDERAAHNLTVLDRATGVRGLELQIKRYPRGEGLD